MHRVFYGKEFATWKIISCKVLSRGQIIQHFLSISFWCEQLSMRIKKCICLPKTIIGNIINRPFDRNKIELICQLAIANMRQHRWPNSLIYLLICTNLLLKMKDPNTQKEKFHSLLPYEDEIYLDVTHSFSICISWSLLLSHFSLSSRGC